MGQATGGPAALVRPEVLAWPGTSNVSGVVAAAGYTLRIVSDLDELLAVLPSKPGAVVLVDAARALDAALEACRRIRSVVVRVRQTICVVGVERGATDEARAIEAGADVVWDRSVLAEVVRAVLARVGSLRGADDKEPIVARKSGRARSSSSLGERRFRALLDNVLDIVAVVDVAGVIQLVNPAVRTLLGRRPDALGGTRFWDLLHPDDVPLGRQMLEEALRAEGVLSPMTLRACHSDGSLVTLEITGQSLVDDPSIAGVLLYARDVTERMWVGAALQDSERRFSEVFENMLDGVVQIDEASRTLIQANSAFCCLVGCAREDVFGLALVELFPAEDRARLTAIFDEHFKGKRRISEGIRLARWNGAVRWVDVGTSRVELSGPTTTIAVVRDVTARRDNERSREMFLSVVAHELRTPVAIVRNSVELLRSKLDTMSAEDRTTLVNVLSEEAERLTRLVGDALDMGAIQTGNLALRPHRVALAPIVRSVAARLGPPFRAAARLRLDTTDAHVDPLRFEQVLTNLLDNVWRHCGPTTKVDIDLTVEQTFARVSVKDNGPGFPPELHGDVLERVLVPNGRPTSGIGIGLWLSRRLVESMGGAITVDPGGNGRGACVSFTVPRPEGSS